MKTDTIKNNKTHGRFWCLIKQLPNYNENYKEELKANICIEYSQGRTSSLNELYHKHPADYERMIYDLKKATLNTPQSIRFDNPEGDLWRKRCIAAVCHWLDRQNFSMQPKEKIRYAIGIIIRASNCRDFNKIPSSRLMEIYSLFLKRNDINTSEVEVAILNIEAERFLEQIKEKHFKKQ